MTMDEVITVLSMQEEILQFSHFTNEDAWELGLMLVAESRRRGLDCAVSIRRNNGYTVFKYAGNTTNLNLSLIHISEPTRLELNSYAVIC